MGAPGSRADSGSTPRAAGSATVGTFRGGACSSRTWAFVPAMRARTSFSKPFITAGTTISAATPIVTPTIEIQASSVMKPVVRRVRR